MLTEVFTTDSMRAVFADEATVQRILDVEAALARAEAACGVIPAQAAAAIERHCRAHEQDLVALRTAASTAGNIAIPIVTSLTRAVARSDATAKGFVHWGATSQDVMDTALVLQLRSAVELIDTDVQRLCGALKVQIGKHRHTVLPGRTWLQHAVPVTLGFKLAGVLDSIMRHRERLAALPKRALVLQFGGACGTLASLGEDGAAVTLALSKELGLPAPLIPWHTHRDRVCEVATTLGMLVATLGKLARDLSLLSQSEVAEAFEPVAPGRGGSSTLPHKRNSVSCAIALTAAGRVPNLIATLFAAAVQEHERGLGNWPAEWHTLPEIVLLAAGALDAMCYAIDGLEVDIARMRSNLDALRGLLFAEAVQMALAPALGRDVAHALVASAVKDAIARDTNLLEALADNPSVREVLDDRQLARLFEPEGYLGSAQTFIDRVLANASDG